MGGGIPDQPRGCGHRRRGIWANVLSHLCTGGPMNEFELFATKEQVDAFVSGFEAAVNLIDDDHATIFETTQLTTGEWRVDYGFIV